MCLKTCLLQILTLFILTIGVQNTIDTFHSIILCEYGMCVFYKVTLTLLVCIVSFYTQPICRKNTPGFTYLKFGESTASEKTSL